MRQAFRLTFASVWSWAGILAGSIALANLMSMYIDVGMGPVFERVLSTYRSIVYPVYASIFSVYNWSPPDWTKDLVTMHLVGAASYYRFTTQFIVTDFDRFFARLIDGLVRVTVSFYWEAMLVNSLIGLRKSDDTRRRQIKRFFKDLDEDTLDVEVDNSRALEKDLLFGLARHLIAVPSAAFLFILVSAG